MATIISNGNTTLGTASGFYRVESANLGCMHATLLALTTTRYINVTFANAGNCKGIVLNPNTVSMTDRTLVTELEEYQSVTSFDTGTEKINKNSHGLLDNDIVSFTSTGTLPTGITSGSQYYVVNKTTNDFQISLTLGGAVRALSGTPTGSASVGVVRATKTLTTSEIAGEGMFGTYKYRGAYFTPFIFTTPYAVDTTASKWRFRISHGTGTGTWNLSTSDATNPFYATWCDTAATFTNNDIVIVKDTVIVDASSTFGATTSTGDAVYGVSCVICSNSQNPAVADVCYLKWVSPATSALTLTVGGKILMAAYSGMRIGAEDVTLTPVTTSIASPCKVGYTAHGLINGQAVKFTTTGALPTGITAGTTYYVVNKGANDFEIESSIGGGSINTSGSQSGVHTCTNINRVPIASKATITFTAPAAGTATAGFLTPTGTAANVYGGFSSLFVYGEIPTYQYTTIKTSAVTGQANVICNDNVDWVNGDSVVVGKCYVQGQGVTTIHTVSSVAGDTITLTANLATNDRKAGGTVLKLGSHGVLIQNTGTFSTNSMFTPASIVVSGADLYNQLFTTLGTSYYYFLNYLTLANRSKLSFTDVTHWTNSTSCTYLLTDLVSPLGSLMQRCYGFRQNFATACVAYYNATHKSGRMEVKDSRMIGQYAGTISTATNIRLTVENCNFENARASTYFFSLTGINGIFKNNSFWGSATTYASGGALYLGACVNPLEISGNRFDYNVCAFSMGVLTNVKCIDTDSVFGSEYANTLDLAVAAAGAFPDYIFKSNTGSLVFDETYVPDMVTGGRYGFADFNDTASDDRMVYSLGKTQRDLVTVHTAGGSSFRFEPTSSAERFEFTFDVPTGNIQNKTMTVAVWCKINSATYYATPDGYELPRLNVTYDGSTTTYAEAVAGTDWQLLSCTFTPTTTAGKISIVFSGLTDATGTDRYFYLDDMSILYPAGYKLDLGGLDIWDNALPVLPPIATVISAADIWAVATSSLTGTGTIGKQVSDIKKDTGLIPALL